MKRENAHEIIRQYSEWLDGEGLIVEDDPDEPDGRSHDDLVTEFLDFRGENWIPRIDE